MKLPLLAVQPDKNVFTLDRTLDPKGSRLRLIDDKSQGTRQARKPRTARPPRPGLAAASLRRRDYRPYPQRHQQSAPIPYKEARDFALPTAPPPISKPSGSAEQNNIGAVATFAFVGPSRIRIGSGQEAGMIALSLVWVVARYSHELTVELVAKLGASPLTADMQKVPVEELRRRIEEIFRHLSDWLLAKSGTTSRRVILRSVSLALPRESRFPSSAGRLP